MLLLGEQLITDEVAAVSELVKNSYDADAEEVKVKLTDVNDVENGEITVWDNGNGMSLERVLSCWLELGTLSKAKGTDRIPRRSEVKHRIYLGEKGLGRLAVHKLGSITTLVTRRKDENTETKLTIDWSSFEQDGFLEQVPVSWEVTEPKVFTSSSKGTSITVSKLRRRWTEQMIKDLQENVLALTSPFKEFADFKISFIVNGQEEKKALDMTKLIKSATYKFIGSVNSSGYLTYDYEFNRPDLVDLHRKIEAKTFDIRTNDIVVNNRKPTCGSFKIKIYSWDASLEDQKAVLGETSVYKKMIKPNSGLKLFRDGFRVYPYGNEDNDWLGMDARRVESFELRLSRNQVIGAIEISSKLNKLLIDKTDREGLIGNQAYEDFVDLVLGAISQCEAERYLDRRKLKQLTGKIRAKDPDKALYTKNLASLSKMVSEQSALPGEIKLAFDKLINEARNSLENILAEKEQPLLVAASFGITYLLPTHEIKRNIDEALKILGRMRKSKEKSDDMMNTVISNLQQASAVTNGLAKLGMKSQDETFSIKKAAREALDFFKYKLDRNNIKYNLEGPDTIKAKGKENLTTMLLLNFLDNSFYWLLRKKPDERQIKIIVGEYVNRPIIIVSDSGPGFEDDLSVVTLPFFTRKPDGMGLGLYIADRIAKMNGGNLLLFNADDFPGLLKGANIAVCLQNIRGK